MTDDDSTRRKAALEAFISAIEQGLNEESTRRAALKVIHEGVDMDLVHALSRWFGSQSVSTGTMFSSLAYYLVYELYRTTNNQKELCSITETYCDYIHTTGHILYRQYGNPDESEK